MILLMPVPSERVYELATSITYVLDDGPITLPIGFRTNGASIPRFAWITTGTPYDPRYIGAALLHDFIYQTAVRSRLYADQLFRDLMLLDGVSVYQSCKMYLALRAFGWVVWKRRHG